MTTVLGLPAGFRLIAFDEIDSTSAEALRRLEAGEQPGAVIWARSQTAGRGRRGRRWESPAGNLYATLIAEVPPARPPGQLAFVAALAAGDAVRAALPAGHHLAYKWPNDLLLDGRKLGGILIEGGTAPGRTSSVAVGIGINIARAPDGAASLSGTGARTTVEALLCSLCAAFADWSEVWRAGGFAPVRAAWLGAAHGLGEPVTVRFPDGSVAGGLFDDINDGGALVLRHADGAMRYIATGEVFFAAA
jgi:BirA family biotin operon repressor/biotin-[acetyl-CoA-carboxylase] ligase